MRSQLQSKHSERNTNASTSLEKIITREISNYNACRIALIKLDGDSYADTLPVMTLKDTYRKSTHARREPGDSRVNNGRIYNMGVTAGARVKPIASLRLPDLNMDEESGGAAIVGTQGSKAKPCKNLFVSS